MASKIKSIRGMLMRAFTAALAMLMLMSALPFGAAQAAYDMPYYIEVDITNQIVTVYNTSDGSIARQMITSSGVNGSTPLGTFELMPKGRASERGEWTYFQQYRCYVKYATRIYKGYMFHSLPFDKKDESTLQAEPFEQLGTAASHGCMRLRVDDARFIAKNCLVGTAVKIYESGEVDEELRQLLLVSSYTGADGMSYSEFLGLSEEDLGRGSTGQEVADLQCRLADLGYYDGEITGQYDVATVAAVKLVQKDLGMAQTGISREELLSVLFSENAPVSSGLISIEEGRSGPVVGKLQGALNQMGLYNGDMDSIFDIDVIEALKRFQSVCGYKADGIATPEVQQALYYQLEQLENTFGEGAIPAAEVVDEEIMMATVDSESNIIIREQASVDSAEFGKVRNGDTVIVLDVKDEWANILAGTINGYMYKKYLDPFNQANTILKFTGANGENYTIGHTMEEYMKGAQSFAKEFEEIVLSSQYTGTKELVELATINTGSDGVLLNLRAEPSSDAEILEQVPNGMVMRVMERTDEWTRVSYNESIGYLMNQYLTFSEGDISEVEMAVEAEAEELAAEEAAAEAAAAEEADAEEPAEEEPAEEEPVEEEPIEEDEEEIPMIKAKVITKGKEKAKVYDAGSQDAEEIGVLSAGTEVDVISLGNDEWVKISYDGRKGYMLTANLQFDLLN